MKYLIIMLLFVGCATNKEPDFKPLPPEKLKDLRFICEGYAYKSITIKDIILEEFCG